MGSWARGCSPWGAGGRHALPVPSVSAPVSRLPVLLVNGRPVARRGSGVLPCDDRTTLALRTVAGRSPRPLEWRDRETQENRISRTREVELAREELRRSRDGHRSRHRRLFARIDDRHPRLAGVPRPADRLPRRVRASPRRRVPRPRRGQPRHLDHRLLRNGVDQLTYPRGLGLLLRAGADHPPLL